jgi:hypothetical protein
MKLITIHYPKDVDTLPELADQLLKDGTKVNLLSIIEPGAAMTSDLTRKAKDFATKVTPVVERSAVVGVTGIKKVALGSVRLVSGRDIQAFDTEAEAIRWLNQ